MGAMYREEENMDCKDIEKMMPDFVSKNLSYKHLKQFMDHVETCKECKEELTIKFLITEGMVRLEQGSAFDLQKELADRMEEARTSMQSHRMVKYIGTTLEVIAMLAIGVIIFLLLT